MKKILLIEDNACIRTMLTDILKANNYLVEACENGKAGIDAYRRQSFNLIITDILMPIISGIELIKMVRQENPSIPIIAMSGMDGSASFLNMTGYHAVDITLQKPFKPSLLLKIVKKALSLCTREARQCKKAEALST